MNQSMLSNLNLEYKCELEIPLVESFELEHTLI